MKKNSTDKLLTLNFGRMCTANFLLYASVYLILPLLPQLAHQLLQMPVVEATSLYGAFAAGMFAVGPFYAYLGDVYKRKEVLLWAVVLMMAAVVGMLFVDSYVKLWCLVLAQGGAFGLAETASLTLAIDVTPSGRRGTSNLVFAAVGRWGLLLGTLLSLFLPAHYGYRLWVYLAVAGGLAILFLCSRVYVTFRAPIGLPLCSLDRFLLPRAWFPALNVVLLTAAIGMVMATASTWGWPVVLTLTAGVALGVAPLTNLFIQLSHHCQRGTANTTCQLAIDGGLLLGLYAAHHVDRVGDTAIFGAVIGLLCFCLLTIPYSRSMRVR